MRGLWALLLGPALAWALHNEPRASGKDLRQYAFVTLEPPSPDPARTPEPIFLRLQVNPSGTRCEDAVVSLQDLDLGALSGRPEYLSSTFPRLNRPVDHPDGRFGNFTAAWSFDCTLGAGLGSESEPSRTLLISISSVDGVVVQSDIDLAVRFRQGPEPEILDISGAKYRLFSANEKYDGQRGGPRLITEDDYPAPSSEPVSSPLRRHPREFYSETGLDLKMAVAEQRTKMTMMMAMRGNRHYYLSRQPSLAPSRATLSRNAEEFRAEMAEFEEEHPATWRQKPVVIADEDEEYETHVSSEKGNQREHVLAGGHSGEKTSTTTTSSSDGSTMAAAAATTAAAAATQVSSLSERLSLLLGDQDRTTIIGVAVIFFTLLSLVCISFLRLRLAMATAAAARKTEAENSSFSFGRGGTRGNRHETIFERRARRKNRRNARVEAAKTWLRYFVGSVFPARAGSKDEEAVGPQREHQDQLPHPPQYLQQHPPQYPQQRPPQYPPQRPPQYPQQHSPRYPQQHSPRYPQQRPPQYPQQDPPQYRHEQQPPQKPQPIYWQQGRAHAVETVDEAPRRPPSPDENTTIEDELAQFRAAASMVDDIIAAQQGRSRSEATRYPTPPAPLPSVSPPTRRPQARRVSVGGRSESDVSDCDTLPPYEEVAPEVFAISDGFGFVPGSSAGAPSSSPPEADGSADTGNSDRLGYNK